MKHRVMVTQILRIEKWTVIEVEAETMEDAVEALSSGEIDLPSAADDVDNVWIVERSSLEGEDYSPA